MIVDICIISLLGLGIGLNEDTPYYIGEKKCGTSKKIINLETNKQIRIIKYDKDIEIYFFK